MDENGVRKPAVKEDWDIQPMPRRHRRITLERSFTEEQMACLRMGHVPEAMEDKWFWYMEGDTLYAHRSWTGFCIYRIDFKPNGRHTVTANRNPQQYKCESAAEDLRRLNGLLDWWIAESYDFYNEWLTETLDAIKQSREQRK